MKSTAIACSIAALALGWGSLAQAQDYDRRGADRYRWEQSRDPSRHVEPSYYDRQTRQWDGRAYSQYSQPGYTTYGQPIYSPSPQGFHSNAAQYGARRYDRRGDYHYGAQTQHYYLGGYLPYQYRSQHYYVNDWRGHHLSQPPYGHQWMHINGDYVLIALATGLIANLLLNQ